MDTKIINKRVTELEKAFDSFKKMRMQEHTHMELRHAELFTLFMISTLNEGRPVTPSQLAERQGVTVSAVTHHLNILHEKGFILRSPSKDDLRITNIEISAHGKKSIEHFKKDRIAMMKGMVEYLGDRDSSNLIRIIGKIGEYLNKQVASK